MRIRRLFIVFGLLLATATAAQAQEIDITGTAALTKAPEIATFTVSVSGRGKTGDVAQNNMAKTAVALQERAKTLGLGVSTTGYRTGAETTQRRNVKTGDYDTVMLGFVSTTTYSIKVNDLATLSKALEMASMQGVSRASALAFDLRDHQLHLREARAAAVKEAMANAVAAAKAVGKEVGGVVKLESSRAEFSDLFGSFDLPTDTVRSGGRIWDEDGIPGVGMAAMAGGSSMQFEGIIVPGEVIITASVVLRVNLR